MTSSTSSRSRPADSRTSSDGRPGGSSPAAVTMPATGVRSSCAMFAVTSRSACSRAASASAMVFTADASWVISSLPCSGSRAVRSPSAMRRAALAFLVSRRPSRVATSSPATHASAVPMPPEIHSTRSRSRTVAASLS